MRVLIACEFSGIVRDAFIARGHDAWSCDLLDTETQSERHIKADIRNVALGFIQSFDLMIAHPPCTRLANSGVRWLHTGDSKRTPEEMWAEFWGAVKFYKLLRDAPIPLKAIENPVMHKHAKKALGNFPRHVVQPWQFGDPAFKATGFELHGLPELIPTNILTPPKPGTEEHKKWSRVHREPPSPERWKNRSRTFPGIANAMADQWGNLNPTTGT